MNFSTRTCDIPEGNGELMELTWSDIIYLEIDTDSDIKVSPNQYFVYHNHDHGGPKMRIRRIGENPLPDYITQIGVQIRLESDVAGEIVNCTWMGPGQLL